MNRSEIGSASLRATTRAAPPIGDKASHDIPVIDWDAHEGRDPHWAPPRYSAARLPSMHSRERKVQ